MNTTLDRKLHPEFLLRIVGVAFFAYLFFGFMLLPCLNTLTSIFNVKNAAGERDAFAVIRFFLAGSMGKYVWNSLKLAILLVITVNIVGISIVLLTEYFDIRGAKILRMGYMTTMIYSGVALVTGYMFLYASDGILTTALKNAFPNVNSSWFSGFNAVLFTMTFACTSNHALFLRNAIRGIDYNTKAVSTAVFRPKQRRSPRTTLYSPPPSQALNWRAVRILPSPGSSRSITSPMETASKAHSSLGRRLSSTIVRFLRSVNIK